MDNVTERKLVHFDWAAKKLLRSKANFEVLEGFLSELLFDDIKILEVLESESNQDNEDDKYNRIDIKVKNSKGELLIIEVQSNNETDFFHRILYATSKTICEHIELGSDYSKVAKVISVNILYFDLGEGSDYIYRGKTTFNSFHNKGESLKLSQRQQEKFKKVYPGDIYPEYYIIKVNNFNDVAKSPLDEWIYLFKNSAIKSNFKAKGIEKAGVVLDEMKMSREERLAYEHYMYHKGAAKGDWQTALDEAIGEHVKTIKQLENSIQEKDSVIQEKDSVIQEKDSVIQEKDSVIQEKDSMLQEKDSVIQEKDSKLQQLAQMLLANGFSKEQIQAQTGVKL